MNPLRRPLVREALRQGWRVRHQRTHVVLVTPAGSTVVLASSPGRGRAERNERALLKRYGLEVAGT